MININLDDCKNVLSEDVIKELYMGSSKVTDAKGADNKEKINNLIKNAVQLTNKKMTSKGYEKISKRAKITRKKLNKKLNRNNEVNIEVLRYVTDKGLVISIATFRNDIIYEQKIIDGVLVLLVYSKNYKIRLGDRASDRDNFEEKHTSFVKAFAFYERNGKQKAVNIHWRLRN